MGPKGEVALTGPLGPHLNSLPRGEDVSRPGRAGTRSGLGSSTGCQPGLSKWASHKHGRAGEARPTADAAGSTRLRATPFVKTQGRATLTERLRGCLL